jgi:hypothetical protein
MKKSFLSLFTLLAFASAAQAQVDSGAQTLARVQSDLPILKSIIGGNLEIAGAYVLRFDQVAKESKPQLLKGDDYLFAISNNYAFGDLNKDGFKDLVLAVEKAPTNASADGSSFGAREIRIYLGKADGTVELFARSTKAVLRADEGGMMGEPLNEVSIGAKGVVTVTVSGGAGDKWMASQKFQMRNGKMVLIGRTDYSMEQTANGMNTETTDTNLITGDQIIKRQIISERENRPVKENVTKKKVAVHPLVQIQDAQFFN